MAKKEAVLKILGRYQNQLSQGVLPKGVVSVLQQYADIEGQVERKRDIVASTGRLLSSVTIGTSQEYSRIAASSIRGVFDMARRASSIQKQPEYEIGVFARDNLSLKPDDSLLSSTEMEENEKN